MFGEFLDQFKWYRRLRGGKYHLVSILDNYVFFWIAGEANEFQEVQDTEEYLGFWNWLCLMFVRVS